MGRPQNELGSSCKGQSSSCCHRPNLVLISAAAFLLISYCSVAVHAFSFTTKIIPRSRSLLNASREKEPPVSSSSSRTKAASDESSWSRRNINGKNDSRLGVRRRVRNVLERAKTRTGIKNASEQLLTTKQSSSNVLAESASIGGLGDADDVDVSALELSTPPVNGSSKKNGQEQTTTTTTNKPGEVDSIRSDVPAAVATTEPLPFVLPELTDEQRQVLLRGERLQEQTKMGRDGSGYVVVDVKAPEYVVWECLLDFESYTETIPTVRKVTMLTSTHTKSGYHSEKPNLDKNARQLRHYGKPSLTRAAFTLSKFRLNIAAIHTYRPHPEGHYMDFCLDPDCTNLVLKAAKGIWYTQTNPEGRGEEYTRVWLLCDLKVSRALPSFIVDYAAQRAMPRATTWLKPQVEAAAALWLKNGPPPSDPLL